MDEQVQKIYGRIPEELNARLDNYMKLHNMSKNQIIVDALSLYLDVNTGLYDFNDPALQRLNQILDATKGLSERQNSTREALDRFYDVFVRYTNGDNYLDD